MGYRIVCDFDGTIATSDVTDVLLEVFAAPGWYDIEALISARGPVISAGDLPPYITEKPCDGAAHDFPIQLDDVAAAFERGLIIEALNQANGVQVRAAQLLGINERSLWHRLRKYDIAVSKTVGPRS
jgi:two-component system, NtrC family, response regulator AtoC